jgi:hypothetical protein
MDIDDMDPFPHGRRALYDTLCRDLRAERNKAVLHPERRVYHGYNARMSARLLELLFPEAVPRTRHPAPKDCAMISR